MSNFTELTCHCGQVRLRVEGEPMLAVECQCNSCRKAAARLSESGRAVASSTGGTDYAMYRKDRAEITSGSESLVAYRLTSKSPTRRVVAGCCGTPMFLEFKGGHWLSIYAGLWPAATRPAPVMRTMVSDLPEGQMLPSDIPNHKTQSLGFVFALLTAWMAMGFRTPKVEVAREVVWDDAA